MVRFFVNAFLIGMWFENLGGDFLVVWVWVFGVVCCINGVVMSWRKVIEG